MINHDKLKANREGGRRQTAGWRPKEGPNKIRILPPHSRFLDNWDAMDYLAIKFEVHFFNIEGRKNAEVRRCLGDSRQRCPACAVSRHYKDSDDPGIKEMAKKVRSTSQYLFNMMDHGNLQAGIQPWIANYTSWDKIIEVAANPSWGNIVDPACGIDFTLTLTPGSRSKSGHNSYSAVPDPAPTNIMPVLDTLENWRETLDKLEDHVTAYGTYDEMVGFLEEMGFSIDGIIPKGTGAAPAAAPAVASAPAARAAAPVAASPVRAAPVVASPVSAAPVAAAPVAAPVRAASKAASVNAAPKASAESSVHYDPGPDYTPVLSDDERPAGVPRCYGDYEPKKHKCQQCPVLSDCQMRVLGIE